MPIQRLPSIGFHCFLPPLFLMHQLLPSSCIREFAGNISFSSRQGFLEEGRRKGGGGEDTTKADPDGETSDHNNTFGSARGAHQQLNAPGTSEPIEMHMAFSFS